MKYFAPALMVTLALGSARADARPAAGARPVLVELFTSQACSSCPPADALLAALQQRDKNILPLSFNVTYWNSPAWMDQDSLPGATDRQKAYATLWHSDTIYTPQAVVDGRTQMVGSDAAAVTAAITTARGNQNAAIPITITGDTKTASISIGQGKPALPETIWLFGFDAAHTTQIGGGENSGATVTEVNVVRSITALSTWSGKAGSFNIPHPAGSHLAVVLQRQDGGIDGLGSD